MGMIALRSENVPFWVGIAIGIALLLQRKNALSQITGLYKFRFIVLPDYDTEI